MKKIFVSVFAAAVALSALTGCTRTSYAIHTNDGRTIVSDGKPKESDSGLLGYTDANGVKQQINKTDVKEVSEIPHEHLLRKRPLMWPFSLPGVLRQNPSKLHHQS